LLVENEQGNLDILTRALARAGYEIDTANDGPMALRKASLRDYDLIIANVRMPTMGGEAFYYQLCSSYPHLSKRVILY
jgi:CheY-like chemotaxis protein